MSVAASLSSTPQSSPLPHAFDSLPFASPENISIIVLSAGALVVSGVALALLFTPIGAGVVGMGLLIGCVVLTGVTGVAALGYIIHKYAAHVDLRTRAQDSASAAIKYFNQRLLSKIVGIHTPDDTPLPPEWSSAIINFQTTFPTDFSQEPTKVVRGTVSKNFFRSDWQISLYLKSLFCVDGDQLPLIPLLPASIDVKEWRKLRDLEYHRINALIEQDKQKASSASSDSDFGKPFFPTAPKERTDLIRELQKHFDSQPACVKEYILLYHFWFEKEYNLPDDKRFGGKFDNINKVVNWLIPSFVFSFRDEVINERDRDFYLVNFIIRAANELFPSEYLAMLGAMKDEAVFGGATSLESDQSDPVFISVLESDDEE